MEWFYANESDQQVSFQEENLQGLVEIGTIKQDTLVWNETMSDWKACSTVRPALFGIAPSQEAAAEPVPAAVNQPPIVPPAPVAQTPNDGLAIASLICGICTLFCWPLGLFLGIAAVICGSKSRKALLERTGSKEGGGLALAGVILGYIGIVISILYIVFMIAAIAFGEFQT